MKNKNLAWTAALNCWRFRFPATTGITSQLNLEQLLSSRITKEHVNEAYMLLEGTKSKAKGLAGKRDNSDIEARLSLLQQVYDHKVEIENMATQAEIDAQRRQDAIAEAARRQKKAVKSLSDEELQELIEK